MFISGPSVQQAPLDDVTLATYHFPAILGAAAEGPVLGPAPGREGFF